MFKKNHSQAAADPGVLVADPFRPAAVARGNGTLFCYGMVIGTSIQTNGCRRCILMRTPKHQTPTRLDEFTSAWFV